MKNYIREIFWDIILSIITKKYGTSLNDDQREDKADKWSSSFVRKIILPLK